MTRHSSQIIFSVLILSAFIAVISPANAQRNIREDVISFPMIGASMGFQLPGGDMADRFGSNFNTGAVFMWKLKSNWVAGITGEFLFGDNVRENHILDKFKTPDGNIISGSGQYAVVLLSERGLKLESKIGKIFPVLGPNKNSGLFLQLGAGYMQHKILIETPDNSIPYLSGDYRKGYDRLSTGPVITEFLGIINFSNNRRINFYAGIEMSQAFTKNIRDFNFDTGQTDTKSRTDLLFGIRAGWVFPIYKRMAEKIYYN